MSQCGSFNTHVSPLGLGQIIFEILLCQASAAQTRLGAGGWYIGAGACSVTFREGAAFVQVASDLDVSTQHQFLREGSLAELTIHKQFMLVVSSDMLVCILSDTRTLYAQNSRV